MPPLPPAPGIAKIIIAQTYATVNVFNILHAKSDGATPWTPTECSNMASAVRAAWVTNFLPLQVSNLSLGDVTVIDLSSPSANSGVASGTNAGALSSASALPANVAACISWKIQNRYRGGHPRTYVGGMATTQTANPNTWASTHLTALTNAANAMRNAIQTVSVSGSPAEFVVVHYVKNKVKLNPPDYDYITAAAVDSRIDTQRRRLGKDR